MNLDHHSNLPSELRAQKARGLDRSIVDAGGNSRTLGALSFLLLQSARGLVLAAILYASWRFGGTDTIVLKHVAYMLLASSCLGAIFLRSKARVQPVPTVMLVLCLIASLIPITQTITLPRVVLQWIAPGTDQVLEEVADPIAAELQTAVDFLDPSVAIGLADFANDGFTISIDSVASLNRLALWQLTFVFFALSALLFTSRESREVLAWVILVNAACLAFWGLAQRASGTTDLLPGFTKESVTTPFSTFVYKNAGAAALIPGTASVLGLLWKLTAEKSRYRGVNRSKSIWPDKRRVKPESMQSYRNSPNWTNPGFLTLLCLAAILTTGLLASSSRGAAVAMALSSLALLFCLPLQMRLRSILMASLFTSLCVAVIGVTGLNESIQRDAQRLGTAEITNDSRFVHWRDGWRTAVKHLPTGAGLGTFGYAHLPMQSSDTEQWFREAHNHYLETFVEFGIGGILIVALLLSCLLHACISLIRNPCTAEHQSWGVIGLFCTVAIAIQSLVDFVLLIPGVVFPIATLMGSVLTTRARDRELRPSIRRPLVEKMVKSSGVNPNPKTGRFCETNLPQSRLQRCLPFLWCAICCVLLMLPLRTITSEVDVQQVLKSTRFTSAEFAPSEEEAQYAIAYLSDAIIDYPSRADLYRRRGLWHLAAYRLELLQQANQARTTLDWQATSFDNLFQTLCALSEEDRAQLVLQLTGNERLQNGLIAALVDHSNSLRRVPLNPNAFLTCATLAPLTESEITPWIELIAQVSHSSRRLQFSNGLLAYHTGDQERMVDQWNRSQTFGADDYFQTIVQLSERTMPLSQVISQVIPETRTELDIALVQHASDTALPASEIAQLKRVAFKKLEMNPKLSIAERHAQMAKLEQIVNDWHAASEHWEFAVKNGPRNLDYRFQFCRSLYRDGQYEKAWDQATLARSLDPIGERFPNLMKMIQRELDARIREPQVSKEFHR